jgi:hypothetical protein
MTCKDKAKKVDSTPIKPISSIDIVVEQKPKVTKEVVTQQKMTAKKPKAPKTIKMPTGSVRDPKTGDEVKIASSYRMLRRWVKDALVEEGLVDKVYKTSELNTTTQRKINKALNTLKKMDKYQ